MTTPNATTETHTTPAEDARIRALATVQALHSEGRISDTAAAALNQSLETPDAVEGT